MSSAGSIAARCLVIGLGGLALTSRVPGQDAPDPAPDPAPDRYHLGDGLEAVVGPLTARLRMRLHADMAVPDLDDLGAALGTEFDTVTDIRRARALFDLRGTEASGYQDFRLHAQVDFADLLVQWLDFYALYDGLIDYGPIEQSNASAGEFREPFGLEAMTSSSYLPFIERSTATNAFTPGRSRGVQIAARSANGLLQLGAFRRSEGLPFPDKLLGESAITSRLVWQGDGDGLVQAGGSLTVRDPKGELLVFQARTGTRLFDQVVETESIKADAATTAGVEALFQRGRWTAQSEWFGLWIDGANGEPGESFLTGGYASVSTFLGEGSSTRNRMRGSIRMPDVPDVITGRGGGFGAVEAAGRVSWTDLSDGSVRGGRALDVEAGLNWYLTPTTRVMLHWVGLRGQSPDGVWETGSAILGRIQFQI